MTILELRQLHLDVFTGRSSYIRLLVHVKGPGGHTVWHQMYDPAKALESFMSSGENTLRVDSDLMPGKHSNFSLALMPALFGGRPELGQWGHLQATLYPPSLSELWRAGGEPDPRSSTCRKGHSAGGDND